MGFSSGNTREEDLGEQEKSPGVKDVACVLPHCPEEDKLEENHQDDDYETYRSFLSLCSSREVKIVPRKSTPVESGGNSELSPLDSPGHCDWPLAREDWETAALEEADGCNRARAVAEEKGALEE